MGLTAVAIDVEDAEAVLIDEIAVGRPVRRFLHHFECGARAVRPRWGHVVDDDAVGLVVEGGHGGGAGVPAPAQDHVHGPERHVDDGVPDRSGHRCEKVLAARRHVGVGGAPYGVAALIVVLVAGDDEVDAVSVEQR